MKNFKRKLGHLLAKPFLYGASAKGTGAIALITRGAMLVLGLALYRQSQKSPEYLIEIYPGLLVGVLFFCWGFIEHLHKSAISREKLRSLQEKFTCYADVAVRHVEALEARVRAAGDMEPLPKKPGRPKGAGGHAEADAPIVDEMRQLIITNPDMTAHGAAVKFAPKASGVATEERKARRLADRYREKYESS